MIAQAFSEIIVSSPLALILALRYEVCESAGRFIGGRAIILRPLCPTLSFGRLVVIQPLSRKKKHLRLASRVARVSPMVFTNFVCD